MEDNDWDELWHICRPPHLHLARTTGPVNNAGTATTGSNLSANKFVYLAS